MGKRMKGHHVSSIARHSSRVTHHGFYYRSSMGYLASVGFIPKMLAEIGLESSSFQGRRPLVVALLGASLKFCTLSLRSEQYAQLG